MTRNEYIAETAARYSVGRPSDSDAACIGEAERLADSLEACGFAPWQTAPTPATDTAAKVVEAAVDYVGRYGVVMLNDQPLVQAVRAHLAAQGGAK